MVTLEEAALKEKLRALAVKMLFVQPGSAPDRTSGEGRLWQAACPSHPSKCVMCSAWETSPALLELILYWIFSI